MALQSQIFSVGDFTRYGVTNGYILDLILTEESTSVEDNTSIVSYVLQLRSGGSNRFTSSYFWCKVNLGGQEETANPKITAAYNHTYTLMSGSIAVVHNEDGSFSLPWSASMWNTSANQYAPYDTEFTGAMTLTDIPRASAISAADANIGARSTIVINRKSSDFTHSVVYQFGDLVGYIDEEGNPVEDEIKFSSTTVNFAVPKSFYAQIPEAPSGECRLTCKTYSGTSQVGDAQTCSFKATAAESDCAPAVSGHVEDINPLTLELTGDANVLVKFYSTARCAIEAVARNGAVIVQKTVNGTDLHNTLDIADVETGAFAFRTKDSRGYMCESPVIKTVIPYIRLTANLAASRDDPTSGNATLNVNGSYYAGGFGAAENELLVRYRIGTAEYVTLEPEISDGIYSATAALSGLDYTATHSIEVEVTDKLATVTKKVTVNKGIPVFDWGESDFAFHVPVDIPQLSINGQSLEEYIKSVIQGG